MGGVHGVAVRRRGGPCTGSACGSAVDSDDVSRQRADGLNRVCGVFREVLNVWRLRVTLREHTHSHTHRGTDSERPPSRRALMGAMAMNSSSSQVMAPLLPTSSTPSLPVRSAIALQRELNASIARGADRLTVPAGEYFFGATPCTILGASNIVLDFAGSSLWFRIGGGLLVSNGNNVSG